MISVMCTCGKRLKTEDRHAGRKTKCPNCQGDVVFPEAIQDPSDVASPFGNISVESVDVPPVTPSPVPPQGKALLDTPFAGNSRERADIDPWYYDVLLIFALGSASLSAFPFVILTAMTVGAAIWKAGTSVALLLPFLFGAFVAMLFVMLMVSPILLALDMARNIRQTRLIAERMAGSFR